RAAAVLRRSPPVWGCHEERRPRNADDAPRRSVERGKSNTLDLQEATEEATFKGTMTLVGCSLIWITVILVIFSVWVPWVAWFILPALGAFLVLQGLRWIVPSPSSAGATSRDERPARTEKIEKPEKVVDTGIKVA